MDPMEHLWQKAAKPGKDGADYIFFKGVNDLAFLYVTGFVDVQKHGFQVWIDSFQSSRQKDGSYAVNHDQWIEKKKYRYSGLVKPPFDPNALEEREYTEKEIETLLTKTIVPNTMIDPATIPQMMNNLRAQKRLVNGRMTIDKQAKEYITQLLQTYPSPTRILELLADGLKKLKKGRAALAQQEIQKSVFAAGQSAQEIAASRLAEMQKVLKKEKALPLEGPSVSLKDLQKKRPPSGRV